LFKADEWKTKELIILKRLSSMDVNIVSFNMSKSLNGSIFHWPRLRVLMGINISLTRLIQSVKSRV